MAGRIHRFAPIRLAETFDFQAIKYVKLFPKSVYHTLENEGSLHWQIFQPQNKYRIEIWQMECIQMWPRQAVYFMWKLGSCHSSHSTFERGTYTTIMIRTTLLSEFDTLPDWSFLLESTMSLFFAPVLWTASMSPHTELPISNLLPKWTVLKTQFAVEFTIDSNIRIWLEREFSVVNSMVPTFMVYRVINCDSFGWSSSQLGIVGNFFTVSKRFMFSLISQWFWCA